MDSNVWEGYFVSPLSFVIGMKNKELPFGWQLEFEKSLLTGHKLQLSTELPSVTIDGGENATTLCSSSSKFARQKNPGDDQGGCQHMYL